MSHWLQDVPHGALQVRTYFSTPLKRAPRLFVRTPPEYDREPNRRIRASPANSISLVN